MRDVMIARNGDAENLSQLAEIYVVLPFIMAYHMFVVTLLEYTAVLWLIATTTNAIHEGGHIIAMLITKAGVSSVSVNGGAAISTSIRQSRVSLGWWPTKAACIPTHDLTSRKGTALVFLGGVAANLLAGMMLAAVADLIAPGYISQTIHAFLSGYIGISDLASISWINFVGWLMCVQFFVGFGNLIPFKGSDGAALWSVWSGVPVSELWAEAKTHRQRNGG